MRQVLPTPQGLPRCWQLEPNEVVIIGSVEVPLHVGFAVIDGIELRIVGGRRGSGSATKRRGDHERRRGSARLLYVKSPPGKISGFDRTTAKGDRPPQLVIHVYQTVDNGSRSRVEFALMKCCEGHLTS